MSNPTSDFPRKLAPLFEPHRYKVLYGGRGGAKSWGIAGALLEQGWRKPLRVLCVREVQKSIKDSVHQLLGDRIEALGLGGEYQILETEIRGRNGTVFLFTGLSTQTAENLKSYEGVDIVWAEEARAITKRSWDVLIPTIRKPGSEIWISFNPELDTDETYQRFVVSPPEDAVVIKMTYADNPWFPDVLEAERRASLKRDPVGYRNIWEGEPRSVVEGAIYAREVIAAIESKRIRPAPHDPLLKVHTVWDLGWGVTSIILAQRAGSEVRIIDYLERVNTQYPDDIAELEKRRYRWGTDFLPHDARAGSKHSGKSPEETLKALGRTVEIVPEIGVENGISAVRSMFPRVYFNDSPAVVVDDGYQGVGRLVECLKRYHRRINPATNQPGNPEKDGHDHGADAFRYLAVIVDKMDNDEYKSRYNPDALPSFV